MSDYGFIETEPRYINIYTYECMYIIITKVHSILTLWRKDEHKTINQKMQIDITYSINSILSTVNKYKLQVDQIFKLNFI